MRKSPDPGTAKAADRGAPGARPEDEAKAGEQAEPATGASGAQVPEAKAEPAAAAPAEPPAEVYKDRWLRAEAELQNYRRRAAREFDETRRGAEERVMLEIISAIDDLDRAIEAAREGGALESWAEGVRLTATRLREFLGRHGVTVLDPVGEAFDPAFHEAMLEIDAPPGRAPGEVVQVVLKGYARGDRALRPARVVVARAAKESRGEPRP